MNSSNGLAAIPVSFQDFAAILHLFLSLLGWVEDCHNLYSDLIREGDFPA
jgi:hypothetical protein